MIRQGHIKVGKRIVTGPTPISEHVLKQAEAVGMAAALHNLASRTEILDMSLSAEKLMDTLLKAGGLVNKAKALLLAPSEADPSTPAKMPSITKLGASRATPEKLEQDKSPDVQQASARLTSSSIQDMKAEEKAVNLTELQRQRIQENRARALARKAQMGK